MKEGEYRPQPKEQLTRESQQGEHGESAAFNILDNIKGFVETERLQWRAKGHEALFDPAWFLHSKLKGTLSQAIITHSAPEETLDLMGNVMSAYDILAYPHFKYNDTRRSVGIDLSVFAESGVTLDPKGVPLLEKMAEATDIPYTKGQTRFELPSEVLEQFMPSRIVDTEDNHPSKSK